MQQLSKRLSAVAALVTPGETVIDVGTDHGYIPIFLVQTAKMKKAIAMDVHAGPLKKAQEHIAENHLEDCIITRLSDGLRALEEKEGDCVVIAGMGGNLMQKILEDGHRLVPHFKEMILQPQSDLAGFRQYLRTHHLRTVAEDMVLEDGKFYPMMRVVYDREFVENTPSSSEEEQKTQRVCDLYGKMLLEQAHPVLLLFLNRQKQECEKIIAHLEGISDEKNEAARKGRIDEIKKQQALIAFALEKYF